MAHEETLLSLQDIGYHGSLETVEALEEVVRDGPESPTFTKLAAWLVAQLKLFSPQLEESVRATNSPEDAETFKIELSGVLRELGCPHGQITRSGGSGLDSEPNRWILLNYLVSEMQCAHMLAARNMDEVMDRAKELKRKNLSPADSVHDDFRTILRTFNLTHPPRNVTTAQIFTKLESKVKEAMAKAPEGHMRKPLLTVRLSADHWKSLEQINAELEAEYSLRRQMLLKRLDVTVQSFQWSERAKGKDNDVAQAFHEPRRQLGLTPNVHVADILAARDDLTCIRKTTSGTTRVESSIKRVLIKHGIPDRGGRPDETRPEPEVPSWMQKPQDQRRGGGRGGGGNRGRVQGGWSGGDWNSSGGGYHGGGGHHGGSGGYSKGGGRGGRPGSGGHSGRPASGGHSGRPGSSGHSGRQVYYS